jgi:integrase
MSVFKRGSVYWYHFVFAGRHVQESTKTASKTLAKAAEQRRRRELEQGFNSLADHRKDHIRTVSELASAYLAEYKLRNRAITFAQYALNHVTRLSGSLMVVDVTEKTIVDYQSSRLREGAAPKTINEEIGFLLRILSDTGDALRVRLRRKKQLKLRAQSQIGRAYSAEEKALLYEQAQNRRSKAIYPALVLALNCGLRDKEIRTLTWGSIHLDKAYLVVGQAKTDAGSGRTVPLNSPALVAIRAYSSWYKERFGLLSSGWYVFPFGKPQPVDPTRPCTSFKTVWTKVRNDAGVSGRWHDNRHTLVTELAESGAGDETIMDIAGHVSNGCSSITATSEWKRSARRLSRL